MIGYTAVFRVVNQDGSDFPLTTDEVERPVRTGVVRADGKVTVDDTGTFHPLGMTFMWAIQGWRSERDRFKQNAEWIRSKGIDYVRILCSVGWAGREIDPGWPDYDVLVGEVIDYFYSIGLRVELTIEGGSTHPSTDTARRVAEVVKNGRQHKVLNFEMANEYDVGAKIDIAEMQEMAKEVHARVPNLLALSSPGSWEDLRTALDQGPAKAFTLHIDRGTGSEKWRQVRQSYDCKDYRGWLSQNEPPGPASSVATNENPLQLAMMRAVGVMCGGSAWVFHTGTGVFGDGRPHPTAGPRPPNFWEIDNVEAMLAAIRGIDALLPEGVENWRVANTGWVPPNPVTPFQPHQYWEDLNDGKSGVNKAYAALAPDGRFVQMPCGVKNYVDLTVSDQHHLSDVQVYDPLTLLMLDEYPSLNAGEKITLPGRADTMTAYIILGRR